MFSWLLAESDEIFDEQDVIAEQVRVKISPFTVVVILDLLLRYGDILFRVSCIILKETCVTIAFPTSFLKLYTNLTSMDKNKAKMRKALCSAIFPDCLIEHYPFFFKVLTAIFYIYCDTNIESSHISREELVLLLV